MTAPNNEQLALLLPADLPNAATLSGPQAEALRAALTAICHALKPEQAAHRVALLQAVAGGLGAQTHARTHDTVLPPDTGIPARRAEVAAFDHYFNLRRVQTDHPVAVLLAGLVQTIIAVQRRAENMPELPSDLIASQMTGFRAYAALLTRVVGPT